MTLHGFSGVGPGVMVQMWTDGIGSKYLGTIWGSHTHPAFSEPPAPDGRLKVYIGDHLIASLHGAIASVTPKCEPLENRVEVRR